jgi:TP901 family phage tail tape measure protein
MAKDINIRVGADISELEKNLNKAQRSLRRSGQQMSRIGNDMIMSLTAPIGIFGASILGAAADFESSMNGMKAVTAGGAEAFEDLSKKAKELGATTQFSATEAAGAMEMLGRNGLTATQILDGAADASLGLAAATGTDLANAANVATDAMAQFGLASSDLVNVSDLITGATVNSKFSIDDFQLAMAQAGGVAGAVGVSFEDFATTISAISPSFASGSDAGTSLKTMLTRLVPQTKDATAMMKQLGIITKEGTNQFFDANGAMKSMSSISGTLQEAFKGLSEEQKISASQSLFGNDAMRAGLKLAEVGSGTFDNLAASIAGVSASEVAATRMEGFKGAVLKLKSAFETLQLAIADSGVLAFATSFVESLTNMSLRMAALDPAILQMGVSFLAILAAIGPVVKMMGMFQLVQAQMAGTLSTVVGRLTKLGSAINFVTSAEGRALIVTKAKDLALKAYNLTLAVSNKVLSLFKLETYKAIAATIAQTTANIAVNAATFAGVAIIKGAIAIETAYGAAKKLLTSQIKITTIAQKAFNLVLLSNPIGLAVIAIMGLVAAFTAAYQNLDWFRNFVDKSLEWIKDKFAGLLAKIKFVFMNFPAILKAGMEAIKAFGSNIMGRLKRLGLAAEKFRLKFARALTIDADKRKEITKQIEKIGEDSKVLENNAKEIGSVFRNTLEEEIAKVKPPKVSGASSFSVGSVSGGSVDGGQFTAANTEQIKYQNTVKATTEALKVQTKVFGENATALAAVNTKQLEGSGMADRMKASVESLTASQRTMKLEQEAMAATMATFNESLTGVLNQGLTDVAVGFGEVVGSMANGTASMADLGGMLLGTLGGLLGQVGQLAIATGVAMAGIKTALQSLNPAVAIIGGVALVALSKVVSSKASSLGGQMQGGAAFAKGGIVDKPTFGVFGEAGTEVIIPKKRLDTYLSDMNGGGGGGAKSLTAKIGLRDLVFALDDERRKQNRV